MLPFHVFYKKSRIELGRTLSHILVSPFGPVKFKDFFLADILTSMIATLRDFVLTIFLIISGQWYEIKNWALLVDPKKANESEESKK
jgi:hypothetical protein